MKQFFIILLVLVCAPSMHAQANVEYVKNQYPEVYLDVYENAVKQFPNSELKQEKNIQEQVYAFLQIAESDEPINKAAMKDALLRWSRAGYEAVNRSVIEDRSIDNPYPHLRCDWAFVRMQYKRTNGGFEHPSQYVRSRSQASYSQTNDGYEEFASVKDRSSNNYNYGRVIKDEQGNLDRDRDYQLHYSAEYKQLMKKQCNQESED